MDKFVKFSDWEKSKYSVSEEKEEVTKEPGSAQLIAELEELNSMRKKAVKQQDAYESQILEIAIKLKKLEIERQDLLKKQKDLSEARELSKKTKLEGRSHDQE